MPPLTFFEFIKFLRRDDGLISDITHDGACTCTDVAALNTLFIDYLNYGGFPELALKPKIRDQTDQFIKNDIIDKVLLKDLPNLYGIQNIQELNKLFSFLAYNTGQEASLEAISQNSGLSKTTITNYVTYLKSAFLISSLAKLPSGSKGILRQRTFKVYLTNPSMRAALFGPAEATNHPVIGHLAEAAILSQWHHLVRDNFHYYYRDKHGNEVDLVSIKAGTFNPNNAVEIKWTDDIDEHNTSSIRGAINFAKRYQLPFITITSRTKWTNFVVYGVKVRVAPASWYCLNVGSIASRSAIDMNWGALEA